MKLTFCDRYVFLAGLFFLVSSALLGSLKRRLRSRCLKALLSLAVFAALLAPIENIPVYAYFRGMAGAFSIITVSLLGAWFVLELAEKSIVARSDVTRIGVLVALGGLALYTSAAGVIPVDIYRFGYRPTALLPVLGAIVIYLWARRRPRPAFYIMAAVAAFHWRVLESDNLWDYLLDPFLWVYSLILITVTMIRFQAAGGGAEPITRADS